MPSGTLWATENIKDKNGNDLYFAWGETQGYTSGQVGTDKYFAWEGDHADYKYGTYDRSDTENYGMTKYNKTDGKAVLDPEDDAATANWGSDWRMPTKEEFEELLENTYNVFITVDGVKGLNCRSKVNDNRLFFPAVSFAADGNVVSIGYSSSYWSASLLYSVYLGALLQSLDPMGGDDTAQVVNKERFVGLPVHPVRNKK